MAGPIPPAGVTTLELFEVSQPHHRRMTTAQMLASGNAFDSGLAIRLYASQFSSPRHPFSGVSLLCFSYIGLVELSAEALQLLDGYIS